MIPGGHAPDKMRMRHAMVDLVRDMMAAGKPVAAICHGPQLLISVNALRGRTLTCWPSIAIDVKNAGGLYVDARRRGRQPSSPRASPTTSPCSATRSSRRSPRPDAPGPDSHSPVMRIGIDLGGTKIEAVVLDEAGVVVFRERRATPRGEYDGTIEAIASLVAAAEASIGTSATVGIGMPGAISPATGLVKNANSTWLNGRPLDRDLATRLGRPVRLANDANCFALSEASDGAARRRQRRLRRDPGHWVRRRGGR